MDGARFVPGLYRLLAHWPSYLAHVAVAIGPLFKRDDIVGICSEIVSWIDRSCRPSPRACRRGRRLSTPRQPRRCVARFGFIGLTSPQMIVFSAILRDALPETSSI